MVVMSKSLKLYLIWKIWGMSCTLKHLWKAEKDSVITLEPISVLPMLIITLFVFFNEFSKCSKFLNKVAVCTINN